MRWRYAVRNEAGGDGQLPEDDLEQEARGLRPDDCAGTLSFSRARGIEESTVKCFEPELGVGVGGESLQAWYMY